MKIYKIEPDAKYAIATLADEDDIFKCSCDGNPKREWWEPVPIRFPTKSKRIGDLVFWTQATVVASQKAVDTLAPLISPYVEVLPLRCEQGNYYLINGMQLIDCIDYTKSEYIPCPWGDEKTPTGAPRVLAVTKPVFYPHTIEGYPVFKEINFPKIPLYVSDAFVDCVEQAGLRGVKFNLLWEG